MLNRIQTIGRSSKQLIAIAKCIGRWLKIPVTWEDLHIEPDPATKAVVEQAIAALPNAALPIEGTHPGA